MKVIVVGCTHAGTAAISQMLVTNPDLDVEVYERHDNISFLSCGISLYLDGRVQRLEDMFYSSPEALRKLGAHVHVKHDVLKIDAKRQTVVVEDLINKDVETVHYDRLVMTTGSTVIVPPLKGIDSRRVLLCKDYDQAKQIYKTAEENKHITIVGAGYVGVELAESYASTEHVVSLFQNHKQILVHSVDQMLSENITQRLVDHDVDVHLHERVTGFSADPAGDGILVETESGHYPTDLAIVATGFVPNTGLLSGQVDMLPNGAILTDDYMQSSDPHIFAAGDACAVHFNPTNENLYAPLASTAVRQGTLVGLNLLTPTLKYMGTQSTSAMEIFGSTLATTGSTLAHAQKQGIDAATATYEGNYRPAYMPSTAKLTIALVYDRDSRRILGGQLLCEHEVAQSANTLSVCIQNKNTIDDLAFVDMLFQPNYDEPFNYLNQVAQIAVAQEQQRGRKEPKNSDQAASEI
ncbi:MAG: FAD-dependent oxidoreductase [Furfurilactobacillus sp.]|jgi:NADPH-dependent 2,4-dienoyl-CoA reductase/sulfur reductase-like enzyme|uniref:FAD-dependent oxidoreductase n=1 Tax=Furfurilactobacillus TaxID=2767882 RepID=UPI001F3EE17E|nr:MULTISPECIES: FAD-dependent oxidoreductase [Furfurilactobacillus]MCF6418227.1 FAD-dependent oxidoreductase [Furfurilactobacillus milii]MCH4011749.1 FAD-dependent oxidoreductase [Furfurilactobacillus sp.]MCH4037641.1 FAD-dependent oxidoreductase [Furfurilactobacillus sp.]MCH4115723.1 FAD-dependent oxidoreductase [Furfurilactobacillus sp.]MCI1339663.1 FAD-dependent oxidoreductase [Furfurilactobacillus sp.]